MAHGIKINVKVLNTYLIVGLVIVLLAGIAKIQLDNADKLPEAAPEKVSNLQLVVVKAPGCKDCFDSTLFAAALNQLPNVNVTETVLEYNDTGARELIDKYGFARLPAAVVTGETKDVPLASFKAKDDGLYFDETPAPYYDVSTKRVVGRIAITYITSSACPLCFNITQFSDQLKEAGVVVAVQRVIEANEKEAQSIISKYGITKIPAMLMSADALEYPIIAQVWPQVGTQESDGMLVMRNMSPPYYDFTDSKLHGLVTITYLTDKSCNECYDAEMHKEVLASSFGIQFKEEKTVDVSTKAGKELVQKYGLRYLPALLLDKEASAYPSLTDAWTEIGTIADDGTYAFTKANMLGGITYKDLETNTTNTTPQQ
jgi:thiol-disulfide isomerase/thioredoxin